MTGHKLAELLSRHVCLIRHKKESITRIEYFTNSPYYEKKERNKVPAFNLIKEQSELLDPFAIEAIMCADGSLINKIELSCNNSKQKLKKLKEYTSEKTYEYLLENLTNQQDLIFCNGLAVDDFLFVLGSNPKDIKPTIQKIKELFDSAFYGVPRSKILLHWVFGIELGKSTNAYKIKKTFINYLQKAISREKTRLIKDWPSITKIYSPLFDKELQFLLKHVDRNLREAITKISSHPDTLSEEDLAAYLGNRVWPKNIQPNPFSIFI